MDIQFDDIVSKLLFPAFVVLIAILVIKSIELKKKIKADTSNGKPKRNIYKIILAILFIPIAVFILFIGFVEFTGEGISFFKGIQSSENIIASAKHLILDCENIGDKDRYFRFSRKCLVWDMVDNKLSNVHYLLIPYGLPSGENDLKKMLFIITEKENIYKGKYSISGKSAYQQKAKICVIKWPEKEPVGMFSVYGKPPPEKREVKNWDEIGGLSAQIKNWIVEKAKLD